MFSALCPVCQKPENRELPGDPVCTCPKDPKLGDILYSVNPHSLARKIRVAKIEKDEFTGDCLIADVLEGKNTSDPLRVYRAGWAMYQKRRP